MAERSCSMRGCKKKIKARGLCNAHYLRAQRTGAWPPLQLEIPIKPVHRLTNVDPVTGIADCEACGPNTPIRVGVGRRGHECKIKRAEGLLKLRESPRGKRRPAKPGIHRRRLLKKYGLTEDQYTEMETEQDGRCRVCGEKPERLVVDHDHETGIVRGLLCRPCNLALGFLRDNPVAAAAASRYLQQ